MAFHPDKNTDPAAEERMMEITAAFDILGDEKKRAQFDRGEIDAEGKPRFQGFDGFLMIHRVKIKGRLTTDLGERGPIARNNRRS